MKNVIIYLHSVSDIINSSPKKWLQEFTKNLISSIEKFNIDIIAVTNQKDAFFKSVGGNKTGVYLPIIDRAFLNSENDLLLYRSIIENIENQYSQQAYHLSIIEDILPVNLAQFQPFYRFYIQAVTTKNRIRNNEKYLPGNNSLQSFKCHIENIAKEISAICLSSAISDSLKEKVFIGTSTDDLEEPIKSLSNFLLEKGLDVITPINVSGLSTSFIKKKLKQHTNNCWLSIHPYGNGHIDSEAVLEDKSNLIELENSISLNRFNEAKDNYKQDFNFRRILWTPRPVSGSTFEGRIINRIKDDASRNNNAEILDCSLDELKQIILSYHYENNNLENVSQFQPETGNIESDENLNSEKTVLILYESKYANVLKEIKTTLQSNKIKPLTLDDIDPGDDFIAAKSQVLKETYGVIILSSNWSSAWFKSNLNEVIKTKSIRDLPYNFICLMSREIENLPYDIDNDIQLLKINGSISEEAIAYLFKDTDQKV